MVNTANFPSCSAPSGSLIASYDTGVHGIVGSTAVYTGSDRVYQVTPDTVAQCFCSVDGAGIQSNWWKSSSLSEDQVQTLIAQGWHYVPSGDLWGLTADPYLVQNLTYSCLPSPSSPPSTTTTSTSSNSGSGGAVQGDTTSGSVLGLAATGNITSLILVFTLATLSIVVGVRRLLKG